MLGEFVLFLLSIVGVSGGTATVALPEPGAGVLEGSGDGGAASFGAIGAVFGLGFPELIVLVAAVGGRTESTGSVTPSRVERESHGDLLANGRRGG